MKLDKHIITRFLTDESLIHEIIEATYGDYDQMDPDNLDPGMRSLYHDLSVRDNKTYYCTESMLSKLDLLKVSKKNEVFDWTVFNKLSNSKVTFVFPDNCLLRMNVHDEMLTFVHIKMDLKEENYGQLKWVMFYVNRITGEQCDHFNHIDVKRIEDFIYKLLCFMYLTENDEIVLKPKEKNGTIKTGKVINTLPFPITIVNSRWNTTVISPYKFDVRGHFAIRWTGQGRLIPKIVFINPFTKEGITRKAKSEEIK